MDNNGRLGWRFPAFVLLCLCIFVWLASTDELPQQVQAAPASRIQKSDIKVLDSLTLYDGGTAYTNRALTVVEYDGQKFLVFESAVGVGMVAFRNEQEKFPEKLPEAIIE